MRPFILLILFLSLLCSLFAHAQTPESEPTSTDNLSAPDHTKREVLLRIAPQFGVIGKLQPEVTRFGVERFIFVFPEGNLDVQITKHWFASVSFAYARVRGKLGDLQNGLQGDANVYAPTAGIKIMSSVEDPPTNDFLDLSRWWFGVEFGPYITNYSTNINPALIAPFSPSKTETDFGFNVGAGFDYFFYKNWGAGIQVKLHYVDYSLDDYILFAFGPHLVVSF